MHPSPRVHDESVVVNLAIFNKRLDRDGTNGKNSEQETFSEDKQTAHNRRLKAFRLS